MIGQHEDHGPKFAPVERLADAKVHEELYELLAEAGTDRLRASSLRDAADAGFPMADFECKHGRLPHEGCAECAAEKEAA